MMKSPKSQPTMQQKESPLNKKMMGLDWYYLHYLISCLHLSAHHTQLMRN